MADLFDAVNPAHLPADLDGSPSLRITVLGDTAGQVFDVESGNANPFAVAVAVKRRFSQRRWSLVYVNESTEGPAADALAGVGLLFTPAAVWPAPGPYLWCADPSGRIAAGAWRPRATPLAVQDRYAGIVDISTVPDRFPARVAGYIDGPVSTWPPAAWARFTPVDDRAPTRPGPPPLQFLQEDSMDIAFNPQGQLVMAGAAKDNGDLLVFTDLGGGHYSVIDVTEALHNANPGDERSYQIV